MKSTVYVKEDSKGNEYIVCITEVADMNATKDSLAMIIDKIQLQKSQVLKHRVKTYIDLFLR